MTFNPVNNWNVGDELTSVQMNTLAGNSSYITKAIDKTGDGYANGGGISGTVDVLTTGHLRLVSGTGTALIDISGTTMNMSNSASVTGVINLAGTTNLTTSSTMFLLGKVSYETTLLAASGSTYTCDSGGYPDCIIFVNSSTTSKTITLPDATLTPGRVITIKDSSGNAGSNFIIVKAFSGQHIDAALAPGAGKQIGSAYGFMQLANNGANWFIIAGTAEN